LPRGVRGGALICTRRRGSRNTQCSTVLHQRVLALQESQGLGGRTGTKGGTRPLPESFPAYHGSGSRTDTARPKFVPTHPTPATGALANVTSNHRRIQVSQVAKCWRSFRRTDDRSMHVAFESSDSVTPSNQVIRHPPGTPSPLLATDHTSEDGWESMLAPGFGTTARFPTKISDDRRGMYLREAGSEVRSVASRGEGVPGGCRMTWFEGVTESLDSNATCIDRSSVRRKLLQHFATCETWIRRWLDVTFANAPVAGVGCVGTNLGLAVSVREPDPWYAGKLSGSGRVPPFVPVRPPRPCDSCRARTLWCNTVEHCVFRLPRRRVQIRAPPRTPRGKPRHPSTDSRAPPRSETSRWRVE
jgi:hypothetical protein